MSVRPLSAFDAAALGVTQLAPIDKKLRAGASGAPIAGITDAAAIQLSKVFNFQSYLDTTLLQRAILSQPSGDQIVPSTLTSSDLSGWGVGLHPSSETPVAIRFKTGAQQGASAVYHLKPGQTLWPQGPGLRGEPAQFSGFEWGLPFGWLGGGAATLIIFRAPHAKTNWIDAAELVYHRVTVPIVALAGVAASPSLNWPTRFPWPGAVQGSNSLSQAGQPVLSVTPTRTMMRLRMGTLVAPQTMRCYFIGSDVFDVGSSGLTTLNAQVAAVDVTWGTWTSLASANFATQYQTQISTGELERIGCNNGALVCVESSPATLAGQFVDFIRYGRL